MSELVKIAGAKVDLRPPRGGWAKGMYLNGCIKCSEAFIGDKRAVECADCAYKEPSYRYVLRWNFGKSSIGFDTAQEVADFIGADLPDIEKYCKQNEKGQP